MSIMPLMASGNAQERSKEGKRSSAVGRSVDKSILLCHIFTMCECIGAYRVFNPIFHTHHWPSDPQFTAA
jgi:hypothetical protein